MFAGKQFICEICNLRLAAAGRAKHMRRVHHLSNLGRGRRTDYAAMKPPQPHEPLNPNAPLGPDVSAAEHYELNQNDLPPPPQLSIPAAARAMPLLVPQQSDLPPPPQPSIPAAARAIPLLIPQQHDMPLPVLGQVEGSQTESMLMPSAQFSQFVRPGLLTQMGDVRSLPEPTKQNLMLLLVSTNKRMDNIEESVNRTRREITSVHELLHRQLPIQPSALQHSQGIEMSSASPPSMIGMQPMLTTEYVPAQQHHAPAIVSSASVLPMPISNILIPQAHQQRNLAVRPMQQEPPNEEVENSQSMQPVEASQAPPRSHITSNEERKYLWEQVRILVQDRCIWQGLTKGTMANYLSFYNGLEKNGFQPSCLSTPSQINEIISSLVHKGTKSKPVAYSAIKKAHNVCYADTPINLPRLKMKLVARIFPPFDNIVTTINEMIEKDERELALTSLFLLVTGLRIGEAKRVVLADFGQHLYIKDFVQNKSPRPRPYVFITEQFHRIALKANWTHVLWSTSYLDRKFKPYSLTCHLFRHAYITRRTNFVADALSTTSRLIGHSSLGVTERYMHVSAEEEREIANNAFVVHVNLPE
jgi:hypothetical protein